MKIGKVYEYNGITGKIVSEDKIYNFSYLGLDGEVSKDDMVSFRISNASKEIATDIKPYVNKDLKTLIREYNNEKNTNLNKKIISE